MPSISAPTYGSPFERAACTAIAATFIPFQRVKRLSSSFLFYSQRDRTSAVSPSLDRVVLFGRMALDGIRMPDGCYADGTWELKMHVTDLHRDVSLRVTGEIHIGGVMLKLVEKLGM